jgi:hypothetical protein
LLHNGGGTRLINPRVDSTIAFANDSVARNYVADPLSFARAERREGVQNVTGVMEKSVANHSILMFAYEKAPHV